MKVRAALLALALGLACGDSGGTDTESETSTESATTVDPGPPLEFGSCQSSEDCPPEAPECVTQTSVVGMGCTKVCTRLCETDADCSSELGTPTCHDLGGNKACGLSCDQCPSGLTCVTGSSFCGHEKLESC